MKTMTEMNNMLNEPVEAGRLIMDSQDLPCPHLRLIGTLDTVTCSQFTQALKDSQVTYLGWQLIDASKLGMMTSSGAGALIRCATQAAQNNGGLVLVVADGPVREVIRFMRLDMVIDTFDTLEEARAFINDEAGAAQ